MEIKDPVKLAEKMLETANSKANITGKIILPFLVGLIVLWCSSIEPLVPPLTSLEVATTRLLLVSRSYKEKRKEAIHFLDPTVSDVKIKTLLETAPALSREKVDSYKRDLSDLQDERGIARAEKKEEAEKVAIAFSVPGFPAFNVPTRFGGIIWCVLLLYLLFDLYHTRRAVLTHIGQAAGLIKEKSGDGTLHRPATFFEVPWWVAPLPVSDGPLVSAAEFARFVGWSHAKARNIVVALTLVAVFLVQVRVACIGVASLALFGGQDLKTSSAILIGLCVAIVSMTAFLCFRWFKPLSVMDSLHQQDDKNGISRRTMLCLIATFSIGWAITSAAAKWRPATLSRWLRSPRFRRRKSSAIVMMRLEPGFYVNRKSKVIQYVSSTPLLSSRLQMHPMIGVRLPKDKGPKEKNYSQVLLGPGGGQEAGLSALSSERQHYIIERSAMDSWGADDKIRACQLLSFDIHADLERLAALKGSKHQTRNYYLLAKLAYLSKQDHWVEKMVREIRSKGLEEQFKAEIASWTNSNSRWRKRLKYIT